MCGISGVVTKDGLAPADKVLIEAMTSALRHRGPDGEGYYFDAIAGLGHRRLSIIDLAGGAQPMFNEDRSVVIVFNGEIYNYVEMIPALKGRGHQFHTSSDTEVILHTYEDLGERCVDPLNGMFAFALWDTRRRTLLLARDRMGEKPIFYHHDPNTGRLAFASELKALLCDQTLSREISVTALDDYLTYGYIPADGSIIRGVAKLPPAHRLLWHDGKIRTEPYWDVAFGEEEITDEEVWIAELKLRLHESVRMRLRSDVPLGVFLSGGVDSSAVAAFASQISGRPIKTFSVGFEERDFDELKFARQLADRYGTDHHEIIVRDRDVSVMTDIAYHLDEPLADPSALPTYYVCREARRHVSVCLSGDGGDELFAGYPRYRQRPDYRLIDRLGKFGIRHIAGLAAAGVPDHVRGRGYLQRVSLQGADRYLAHCSEFMPDQRRALLRPEFAACVHDRPWLFEPFFRDGKSLVSTLQHVDQKTYLPDDILVKVDRMSMQNSLEVRVPFLDHALIEFVNRAAAHWKLRRGISKYVLKRMLRPLVPTELLARRKMGFGIPIKQWFRGRLDTFAHDLLLGPDARNAHWLEPVAVRRVLRDHRRGGRDLGRRIWTLLIFELWCRRMGV
jgi:asparagine synthase (glutamine-hydrolysing)